MTDYRANGAMELWQQRGRPGRWVVRFVCESRERFRRHGIWFAGFGLSSVLAAALLIAVFGEALGHASPDRADEISLKQPRVVILKSSRMLCLFDGERLIRRYPIDLGISPVGSKQREGDGRTPPGRFRVVTKNANSAYQRFIGLDYPDRAAADRGLLQGMISDGEASSIHQAHDAGRCPDWSTALGGGIGIHGRRRGTDWTGGCVAVSDRAIEELFAVLRFGDPVEILP